MQVVIVVWMLVINILPSFLVVWGRGVLEIVYLGYYYYYLFAIFNDAGLIASEITHTPSKSMLIV